MKFFILDEREIWHAAALKSAATHGYEGKRIWRGTEVPEGCGVGFIRPHADPRALQRNHADFVAMVNAGLLMIQDVQQVALYEDKWAQSNLWKHLMPDTWLTASKETAQQLANTVTYPVVSKAKEGASSLNVRIVADAAALRQHIEAVWGKGVSVNCCSGGARVRQQGYLILQRFIPHTVTWRVNIVGRAMAIFKRYNYPDRPVAQTGNVEPVMVLDTKMESLLAWSKAFFNNVSTRWCAIDVLQDIDGSWKLLETSLAWPWPSPGTCNEAPFFGTKRKWIEMFDVMFEEIDAWRSSPVS